MKTGKMEKEQEYWRRDGGLMLGRKNGKNGQTKEIRVKKVSNQ